MVRLSQVWRTGSVLDRWSQVKFRLKQMSHDSEGEKSEKRKKKERERGGGGRGRERREERGEKRDQEVGVTSQTTSGSSKGVPNLQGEAQHSKKLDSYYREKKQDLVQVLNKVLNLRLREP
jgi:hypothetical protein